jgi:phosphate starvation-inducible protein PhoH and related proteins
MRHNKESRTSRRKDKQNLRNGAAPMPSQVEQVHKEYKAPAPLRALNEAQHRQLKSMRNNIITFATGCSGVGKTYLAAAYGADLLQNGDITTLILSRPGVEAGRNYGALPGELSEKYAPFMEPIIDVLYERLGRTFTDYLMKRGQIKCKPIEFMRGNSLKNCLFIMDEAQNLTTPQTKMLLTRIDHDTRMILCGDAEQKDIRDSGLFDAVTRLRGIEGIGCVEYKIEDCVRSDLCMKILRAYK